MLPVIFEIDGETTRFELELLWKEEEVEDDEEPFEIQEREESQFVIEDEDDDEDDQPAPKPVPKPAPSTKKTKTIPSLSERLFSSLTDLLFCCGFTLPMKIQVDHYKINYVIWYVSSFDIQACAHESLGKRASDLPSTQVLTKAWNRTKPKFYDSFLSSFLGKYTPLPHHYCPSHRYTLYI